MRILLITPYFYPHKGGSQQYAEELHYHLMKADPSVKVDVLTYNTDHAKEVEEYRGFTIYRVPCVQILPGQFAIPNYFKLRKLLNKLFGQNHYDFINSHTRFFESSWWAPYVARHFKTKSVLTDHCAFHPVHPSKFVSFIAKTVDKTIAPFVSIKYDVVTVTNRATYDFAKYLKMKDPQIIYGGVDTDYFKPQPKKGRTITVTFLGRMIQSKGPQLLYEAAKNILKTYRNVEFIFAGGGPMFNHLTIQPYNHITFLGSIEKKEIANLLKKTDILVHPSLHHEGFPNVLLEAGASGCAIIATDKGGSREIVLPGKTGILIEPSIAQIKHALEILLDDPKKREALSSNIRRHIEEKFNWNKIVRDYQKLIEKHVVKI